MNQNKQTQQQPSPTIQVLVSDSVLTGKYKYLDKEEPLTEVAYINKKGKEIKKTRNPPFTFITNQCYHSYYHELTYTELFNKVLVKGKGVILGHYKTSKNLFDKKEYPINLKEKNFEYISTITLDIDNGLSLKDFDKICKDNNIEPNLTYYTLTNPYYPQDKYRPLFHLVKPIKDIDSYKHLYNSMNKLLNGEVDKTSNVNRIFLGTEILNGNNPLIHINEQALLSLDSINNIVTGAGYKATIENDTLIILPIVKEVKANVLEVKKDISYTKLNYDKKSIFSTFLNGGYKGKDDYYTFCLGCAFVWLKHGLGDYNELITILESNASHKDWDTILNGLDLNKEGFYYYDIITNELGLTVVDYKAQHKGTIDNNSIDNRLGNYQGNVIRVKFDKYIDEKQLKAILKENAQQGTKTLLIAPTGSGKTHSINKVSDGTGVIQVKPRQANVLQSKTEYFKDNNQYLLENVNYYDNNNNGEIYTTTESLYKITKNITSLFVDEVHTLVTENNFRGSSISALYDIEKELIEDNGILLHITATPEPLDFNYYDTIIIYEKNENYLKLLGDDDDTKVNINSYRLPKYKLKDEENLKMYKQLIDIKLAKIMLTPEEVKEVKKVYQNQAMLRDEYKKLKAKTGTDYYSYDYVAYNNLYKQRKEINGVIYGKQKKIAFIYVQDKELIQTLYTYYNELYPGQVAYITKDNKDNSDTYQSIIKHGLVNHYDNDNILNQIKLVLVTDNFSAGVNINDKTDIELMIIGNRDITNITQFIARFRRAYNVNVDLLTYFKKDSEYNNKMKPLGLIQQDLRLEQLGLLKSKKGHNKASFRRHYRALDYKRYISKVEEYNKDTEVTTAKYKDNYYTMLHNANRFYNLQFSFSDFNYALSKRFNLEVKDLKVNDIISSFTIDTSLKDTDKAVLFLAFSESTYNKELEHIGITKALLRKVKVDRLTPKLAVIDYILKTRKTLAIKVIKQYKNIQQYNNYLEYKDFKNNFFGVELDTDSDDYKVWFWLQQVISTVDFIYTNKKTKEIAHINTWYSKTDMNTIYKNIKHILDYQGSYKDFAIVLKSSFKITKKQIRVNKERIKVSTFKEYTPNTILEIVNKELASYNIKATINDILSYLSM